MTTSFKPMTIAIGGLGAIGLPVARWLDHGVPGLKLVAVASSSVEKAQTLVQDFKTPPMVVELEQMPDHADVIVEALPPELFARLAHPSIQSGRKLVVMSMTQLLANLDLLELANRTGGQIIGATGALAGLDAVRAAAHSTLIRCVMRTRKPPASLFNAPFVKEAGIDLSNLQEPMRLYTGNVTDAAVKFPANVNVAVALSLAGWGPDRTEYEIWADPGIERNTHNVFVETDAVTLEISIANIPSDENPATGRMTPLSVMATLERFAAPLTVGS